MYKDAQLLPIDFSKGIDAWNREALLGALDAANAAYTKPHPMQNREHKPGFVDDICNFDLTDDGGLIQRGNLIPYGFANTRFPNSSKNREAFLCTHEAYLDTGTNNHTWMLMIRDDVSGSTEFYRRNDVDPWFTKTLSINSRCPALFYNTRWYFYRAEIQNAWHVLPNGTLTDYTASYANAVSGIEEVLLWKDRAWGRAYNTIVFSKATDPAVWAAPDGGFFQLSSKSPIKAMKVWNDQLYLMDAANGVWVFTFTADPNTDGVLSQIIPASDLPVSINVNPNQGPTRHMCISKGDLYIAGGNNIYQIVNNRVYPIADQLHLDLGVRSELYLFNLGDKMMAVTYFYGATSKNMRCYIYHHNTRAWTRYHFDFGTTDTETDKVYIEQAQIYQHGSYNSAIIFIQGEAFTGLVAEYKPIYTLRINEPFFAGSFHDQIIDAYDGFGGRVYKAPRLVLDTGPIYAGEKDTYKKFLEVRVDAHLGYRQQGTTFEDKPFEASIFPVPSAAGTLSDFDWQRVAESEASEFPYRARFNQIARGIRFFFTNPVLEAWTIYQDTFTSTETVLSRAYISKIAVRLRTKTRLRGKASGTAMADANDV